MSNKTKYQIGREQRSPACVFKVDNPTYAVKVVPSEYCISCYRLVCNQAIRLSGLLGANGHASCALWCRTSRENDHRTRDGGFSVLAVAVSFESRVQSEDAKSMLGWTPSRSWRQNKDSFPASLRYVRYPQSSQWTIQPFNPTYGHVANFPLEL